MSRWSRLIERREKGRRESKKRSSERYMVENRLTGEGAK
jgi:hypothetical protein